MFFRKKKKRRGDAASRDDSAELLEMDEGLDEVEKARRDLMLACLEAEKARKARPADEKPPEPARRTAPPPAQKPSPAPKPSSASRAEQGGVRTPDEKTAVERPSPGRAAKAHENRSGSPAPPPRKPAVQRPAAPASSTPGQTVQPAYADTAGAAENRKQTEKSDHKPAAQASKPAGTGQNSTQSNLSEHLSLGEGAGASSRPERRRSAGSAPIKPPLPSMETVNLKPKTAIPVGRGHTKLSRFAGKPPLSQNIIAPYVNPLTPTLIGLFNSNQNIMILNDVTQQIVTEDFERLRKSQH